MNFITALVIIAKSRKNPIPLKKCALSIQILKINKKKQSNNIYYEINEPSKYAKWKKSDKKTSV